MTGDRPAQPHPENGLHLKRPCMLVTDLDRALTVYRDILGFRLDYLSETASPESYLYKVFSLPPDAILKFAAFSTVYEDRALALTEVKGIPLAPVLPPRIGLVMRVPEIKPIIAQFSDLGLKTVSPNTFITPPNLNFTEQGVYDFDGNLIILYEMSAIAES
jgi:catechol 2,3-dioxygenase-like lactoylglutathione lyase family enzyme